MTKREEIELLKRELVSLRMEVQALRMVVNMHQFQQLPIAPPYVGTPQWTPCTGPTCVPQTQPTMC